MIAKSKQDWTAGSTVKVGFLTLVVVDGFATPGDWKPDCYVLRNINGTQLYKFTPHFGLEKITLDDLAELRQMREAISMREMQAAIDRASAASKFVAYCEAVAL